MYCRDRDLVSFCLSVCKDVCRNPGGIIKLQGRLLKEGSGQKQDIVLRTHLHVLQDFYKSVSYGCKRSSKILGKIQVSMALFLSSYIHQGDDIFSVQSRGKQCAFMSLSALLTAQNIPLIDWSKTTFSNVLLQGDKMYLQALNDGFVVLEPGVEFLSVDNLPKLVSVSCCTNMFSYQICDSVIDTSNIPPVVHAKTTTTPVNPFDTRNINDTINSLPMVVGQNNNILPIVVEPVEAKTIDLPIVVEPIEAKTIYLPIVVEPVEAKTIDLPIVVEPIEAKTIYLPIVVEPVEAKTIDLPIVVEPVEAKTIDLPIVVEPVEAKTIDLPIVVEPIEAKTIDLPIVVEPIEAKTIDLPIVVEPIEAENKSKLPIVVEPIVAKSNTDLSIEVEHDSVVSNEANNENQIWFINYGKELQGLIITRQEVESHYYDIHTALLNVFSNYSYTILILEGYMMALMKQADFFYLFDSHARDSNGMPDPNGTAVVMKFANILELEQYLYSLSMTLHANLFEIVPVRLNVCNATEQKNDCVKDQECVQKKRLLVENEGDKQARLKKASEYNKIKQLKETDKERQIRLQKASVYKKRKQSEETDSEKQIRLEKLSESIKQRRSEETDNEKQIRLQKDSESRRRKRSEETDPNRQMRLQKDCESKKTKRSEETDPNRQIRLQKDSESKKRKQSEETDSERQMRLENDRLNKKQKRAKKVSQPKHEILNQQDYLNMFDKTNNGGIEEQCWAKANINKFNKSVQYIVRQCTVCQEAWPLKSKPNTPYVCLRCSRDKKSPKKFSCQNSMIPSCVPHELQNLTQIEEMLIARALPIMRVYIKPGGQRGYSGHCINLPQNIKELAMSLPRYPKDLAVIIVKAKGRENTFRDVTVRKQKVHDALVWLINNNPHYSELLINEDALNSLPENGVPPDLMTVETDDDIVSDDNCSPDVGPPTDNPSEDIVYNDSTEMSSFLPVGEQQQQEIEAVRNQLSENEPMPWPSVENEPINEYQVSHLATMAFPTLFPDGKGDPTNQELLRDVPLHERIKHLLKFAEIIDGKWVYRFANHPRFSYWAFNMIQRKRILQQSGIFLKQNPVEAHLTIDELREMAASNNANVFMSKVSRYVGNIAGTNAYWNRVREELKAIITSVGAPTLFFTFSSADMHWPELHALFKADTDSELGNSSSDVRRQNVINNPHVVDWFFTQRLESFVKHWLYDTLGAKWHWFRYEYQGRGSIHCHGTAKLNNDPGLCQLTQTALKGFLAQKFKDENDCSDTTELDQDIEAGQKAADTVCQYVDWL